MQEVAAEAAAAGGFITALPMPVFNDSVAETLSEESVDTSSFVLPEENLESEEPESAFVPIEVEF
jgi:sugar/nucleoside kinase (ribokinase family)